MNKRIVIVVPILALLICVSCLSSGAIGSVSTNNQTGEQGSVLGSSQLNNSNTPSPVVTPSPSITPYVEPTEWRFHPWLRLYESGYYDPGMNVLLMDAHSEYDDVAEVNNSVSMMSPSICNPPEEMDGNLIIYLSDDTNSYWGDNPIPQDAELDVLAVMKYETCRYEAVWVAPAPTGSYSTGTLDKPILIDGLVYHRGNRDGEPYLVSKLSDETVYLGCGEKPFDPNDEIKILTNSDMNGLREYRNTMWIAQIDCAEMYDNGNSGRILLEDAERAGSIDVDNYERWVYLKQVATQVGNLPLDSEEYNEFITAFENMADMDYRAFDFDSIEANYRAYAIQATEDAEQKNIRLDSFADYVKNISAIIEVYGSCYYWPECYRNSSFDLQMLTTTPTPYP